MSRPTNISEFSAYNDPIDYRASIEDLEDCLQRQFNRCIYWAANIDEVSHYSKEEVEAAEDSGDKSINNDQLYKRAREMFTRTVLHFMEDVVEMPPEDIADGPDKLFNVVPESFVPSCRGYHDP